MSCVCKRLVRTPDADADNVIEMGRDPESESGAVHEVLSAHSLLIGSHKRLVVAVSHLHGMISPVSEHTFHLASIPTQRRRSGDGRVHRRVLVGDWRRRLRQRHRDW